MSLTKIQKPLRALAAFAFILFAFIALQGCGDKTVSADKGPGSGKGGRGRGGETGPVPVIVAMVGEKTVPINIDVIGNVEAYSTITVKAQISGQLTKVSFQEGDFVKKDDLLFTIDSRPYEAQLNQLEANISRDTAALGQAQADLARDNANEKYAQTQAGRYEKLQAEGVVSKEQSDQQRSSADALAQTVLATRPPSKVPKRRSLPPRRPSKTPRSC